MVGEIGLGARQEPLKRCFEGACSSHNVFEYEGEDSPTKSYRPNMRARSLVFEYEGEMCPLISSSGPLQTACKLVSFWGSIELPTALDVLSRCFHGGC